MADNISKIYEKAKQKGVLAEGLTEEMFRQQTATEEGLKSFYDYATQNGMTFRAFDEFKNAFYKKPAEQSTTEAEQPSNAAEQQQQTQQPQQSSTQTQKPLTQEEVKDIAFKMQAGNLVNDVFNKTNQVIADTNQQNKPDLTGGKSLETNIGKANENARANAEFSFRMNRTLNETEKEAQEIAKKAGDELANMSFLERMAYQQSHDPGAELSKFDKMTPLQANSAAINSFIEDSRRLLKDVNSRNNFTGGVKSAAENVETWDNGLTSLNKNDQLLKAVKKFEKGQELTEDESLLLDVAANYMALSAYYSDKLGRWYKAGNVSMQSLPFMLQFMATPIEGAGNSLTKALVKWGTKSFGRKVLAKAAQNVLVNAPAMTALWGGRKIAAGTSERQIGAVLSEVDPNNGLIKFNGTIGGQSLGKAAYSSVVDMYVENLSEMFFEPFAGLGGKTASIIAKSSSPAIKAVSSAMSKIGGSKAAQVFNKCYNNPFVKTIRDRAHFSGYLGEVAEEEVGGLLRLIAPYNDVTNFEEAGLDWDSQIDTFLGLAPTSILFGGLGLVGAGIQATSRELNIIKYRNGILNSQNSDEAREEAKKVIKYTLSRKDISRDTKADILRSTYYAYQQKVADDIQHEQYEERAAKEQEQQEIADDIRMQAAEDGNIYPVTLDGDTEYEYRIASGNFEIDENRKIVSDEPIIIKWQNETGEWKHGQVSADALTISGEIVRAEDAVEGASINAESEEILNAEEEEKSKTPTIADAYFEKDGEVTPATKVGDNYVLNGTEDELGLEDLEAMGFKPTTDVPELIELNKNKVVIQDANGTFIAERNSDGTLTLLSDINGNAVEDNTPFAEETWIERGATITPYNEYQQAQQEDTTNVQPSVGDGNAIVMQSEGNAAAEQPSYQTDENGEPVWSSMPDSETFANVAIQQAGGNVDIARNFIADVLVPQSAAAKKQAMADAKKKPTSTSLSQYAAEMQAKEDAVNAADAYSKLLDDVLSYIDNIGKVHAESKTAETVSETPAEETKTEDAPNETSREKEKKRDSTEVGVAGHTMRERFDNAVKFYGFYRTITLENGTKLNGRYVLIDAFGLTPSHDPIGNFVKKEGYPTTKDGQSINDRDYEHSKAEQAKVLGIAQVYDGRSLTSVPVVSNEGLVYGGNGRTMAGQIAAVNGTDTAYKEALEENAQIFGFTTEQIANVPNARVVFMLDENLPYNTTSLAMFNENGMQSMNASELAQSITRKMNENGIGHISGMIEGHDDIEKFFQSNDAVTLVDYLISDGIISAADKNEMLDSRGLLSKTGQDVMSAIMLGTALQSDVIRLLENDIALRNNIIKALPVILKNKNFDENLRIIDEINNAIRAIFDMRNYGLSLNEFMRQLIIETDENGNIIQKTAADDYSTYELMLVEAMLSKKKTDFVNQIAEYNKMAEDVVGGQLNIFDEVTQKDDIINAILRINGKEQQDSADTGANSEEQREASRNVEEGSESSKDENSVGGNEEDTGRKRPLEEDTAETAETETKTESAEIKTETAEIKTESEKTKTKSAVSKTESAKTKTDDAVSKTESKMEEVVSKTEGEKTKTEEPDVTNSETPNTETETPASEQTEEAESNAEEKDETQNKKVEVSENRIVDDNLYLKNVEILRKALNNLNIGLNPEVMSAGAIVACYHIERGARTFVAYSKAMMKDLGEIVKPYLKSFYFSAMYMPEMQQYKNEMDSFEYVQAFDVETIKAEEEQQETAQQEATQPQEPQETAQPQEEPNVEQDNKQENGNIQRGVSGSISEPERSDGSVTTDILRGGSKKPRKESRRSDAGGEKAGDSSDRSGLTRVLSESEKKNTRNFRLERGQSNSPKTDAQRYAANMEAIRVLKQLQEEGKDVATKEQQEILSKFTGWGGLGAYFNFRGDNRQEAYALKELLTEEEYADAELSRNSAYYTPEYIIDTLWDIAKKLGFRGGNIAENSAGIGNILAHMPSDISERSNITATEPDAITSGILKYLYPDAVVHDTGYENVNVENGSVDLAITNVPFVSGMRVKDDVEKDLSKWEIHNFCIAKNIRKLAEGGLGIFISTSATMDGAKELRRWIENEGNADVIGLFRLNSETFGGATVTSDIIVVRKRVNGEKSNLAIDVLDTEAVKEQMFEEEGKGGKVEEKKKVIFVNKYLAEHPENLGGEMDFAINHGDTRYGGTSVQCYPADGKNQTELLNQWVESISEQKPMPIVEHKVSKEYAELEAAPEDVKEGGMFVDEKGNIFIKRDGRAATFTYSQNTLYGKPISEVVKDYLKIKDALNALIEKQKVTSTEEDIAKEKKALNDAYDTFVSKYGPINRPASRAKSIIRNDVDFSSIASLENYERHKNVDADKFEENVTKTDIFRKRVIGTVPTMEVRDAKDGVIRSMNQFGELNLPKIAEWLGQDVETTKKQILEDNLGYENPSNGLVEVSYKYLSGNVREKLKYAKEHNENGKYDKNIEALEKVLPHTIPFPFIHFQLGSTWIPISLYSDYVKEKFDVNASFVHSANQWITNQVSNFELRRTKNIMAGVTSQKLNKTVSGFEIFMNAINNRPTVVQATEKDYNGTRTITDKEASQLAANKADEMKDDFVEWVKSRLSNDEKLQNEIETTYNDRFNAIVPMEITQEFMRDQLPGMNPNIKLRVHQQQAVSRALMEPVMLAHEVGSGKTFTLIAIAMEMRRLGTANKPIIIVQNATLGQFAKSAQTLYPSAKILTPSEEDKRKEGRKQFFSKIMYNDWDMIIIPQSSLSMIPDSDERRRDFIREKIEEKEATLAAAREARLDNRQISAIGREIEKLNSELSEISSVKRDGKKDALVRHNQSIKAQEMLERETDDVVNFDELGIDAILLDEAHNYKHLGFETTMTRGVKGIDPSYSKRSASLYLKCQAVFDKSGHKNVVFATGTPISNTAAEVWTFMKYLYPKQFMKDNDIYYFDDFVHNFGRVSQFFEWATDGKPKEVTRFASYINIPELARMWLNCTHTVLAKEINEIKDDVPDIEGGGPTDIFIEQSPTLAVVMQAVRNELKRFEQMTGAQKRENSHIPLVMYGIAKRAAIDPKLVMPNAKEDEDSKLNHTIEHTLKALKDSEAYRGTCAIFCDNYRRMETRDGKKVEVYNMFDDMVSRLVARGVKKEEIVVMKSGMSAAKKEKIFEQVNNGDVRVIIGTTETLGTGVNIQQRLFFCAMMDIPDRPMDYLQRIGRIIRQGNLHKKWGIPVRILRFGVKKSLDVTGYQRLKTKSDFINSIMESKYLINNNLSGRYIEEEEDQGAFDNPIAAISGCQSQVLLSKAERELRKLRAKKTDYENQQTVIINRLRTIDGMNREGEKAISELESSLEKIREYFPNKKAENVSIDGIQINNEEELASAFTEMRRKMNEAGNRVKSDYSAKEETLTFDLQFDDVTIKLNVYVGKTHFFKNGSMVTSASFKSIVESEPISLPATVVPYNVADVYKYLTDRVINGAENEEMIETAKKNIANREEEKKRLQEQQKVSFNNDDEIKAAEERVETLRKDVAAEMAEIESSYQDVESNIDINDLSIGEEDEESNEDADMFVSSSEQGELSESEQLAADAVIQALNDSNIETTIVSDEELSAELNNDTDGVDFLRTPNGVVYGWAKDGKVYLTKNGINPDTPVHEYAHLWLKAVKEKNRELYENIARIFSRSNFASLYDELDTDPNYSSLSEEGKLSEVVSRFSGKLGAEMMTQEADRIINEHPTISNRAKVRMLIGRAKRWLAALWSWVGENLFGIKSFGSAEEVADRVMYDLLNNTSLETGERDTHFNKPTDENTDWQEELDLSTLSPLTIREKVLDSIVSAASQHNATAQTLSKAVDIVNSRIRAIRKAMSAQKMTDRDAIKKLTKMATIFLKNGWINANDRRAISTMIATIGRATEKSFEENARDLLTAVTSAHLNHVKSRFNDARKLKAKKLNISGVAEVDKVDIQTRYMFEAFNDGINLTEDEIDERINETYDKMDDAIAKDDSVTEMEMRNKVNGYIAAQRYVQTVGELLAEGVELKDALADAKNKSYSGVAHPILAKREAVSLAKEAVIDNMLDLAYAYQEITNELRLEGMAGADRATEFRRKLKDNMDKIRHFANSDMEGIDAGEYSDRSFRKWLANSIFASGGLFSPMQALNSILKGLARKAPNGEGYLYDHFVRGFDDAAETEYQGTKALYGELDEKASEIMGKKMSWADMAEKLNKGKTLDLTVLDSKGREKSVELTQGQLAYLYAVNKMNDGQMKLRAMGISSADMDAIEDSLTPEVKEAVDWLQDEFLPRTRVKYNKVHLDMFGTPMARIENYFPLRINKSSIKEEVDLANDKDGIGNLPGTVTGAIKERRRNAKPLDIMNADAFTVAVEHVREMEHWAAFCQLNRDANILLSYQTFKNRLANISTIYGAGKQLYTNIKDAFKVAIGTYQPKKTKASAFSVNIAKGVSASKVSFRLFTAIKQLLSRPAFYTETLEGNGTFLPYFIKATLTPATTFKWAMQNLPLFEKRLSKRTAGDTRLLEDELDWKIWHSKMYEWCSKIGMSPNAFIDALTCAQGAYAIYKSRKGGYINRGMSEEEAEKRALQDASIKFNETQQSSEGAFVSTMQIDKDLASVVASLFQNSTIAYLKRGTEHIAQLYNSLIGVGKEQQVEYLRKKYVRLGFNESDAIDYANTDYKKSIARNAFGIFVFGYFINAFWRLGGNMVYILFGDDDDKKKDLITDSLTGGAFAGPLRGTIIGPGLEAALDGYGWSEVIGADLPIESDIQKNEYLFNSEKYAEFSTNIINMLVAMGLGFNPETITNIGMSIIDACDGDLEYANDFMTLIFTIMSVPESQIKELYIDELGTSAEEIQRTLKRKQYKLDEVAKEYARRRKMKASPIIPMSEEEEKKQEKSARIQIKRGAKERIKTNEQ